MIVGMDFGTTNSGIAYYDGQQVRLLPLDPANNNPHVARTSLYVTNDQQVAIGRQALDRYFDENTGRPVKMKRVWVGEVEVYGADMYYVTDVYSWTDVLSPGRLFLSLKSGLRDSDYQGTVVGRFYYSLENLIALYLSLARVRAERLLGCSIREVVLGRPVRFSMDDEADVLAQRRLLEAAFRAGYEQVYLYHEPTAAAYHYAAGIEKAQNILVFDFGGGTLDITIMRIGGRRGREVLATEGLPVAGDIFDQKLVRAKLPRHFGEGSYHGAQGRRLPMPEWIYHLFSNWQTIFELQTPANLKLLEEIARTADDSRGVEALISLVTNNYGLKMFDVVESAKQKLSTDMASLIRFSGPGFNITETVTRAEFERLIRAERQAIEEQIDTAVKAAGLSPRQIDAVIRTGGSSRIPAFRYMLMEKFGRDKVLEVDTFSSVTSGLAIIAQGIAQGEIEAQPYRPPDRRPADPSVSGRDVTAVNLKMVQKLLMAAEEETVRGEVGVGLVVLDAENWPVVTEYPAVVFDGNDPVAMPKSPVSESGIRSPLVTALDEQILLATSSYRFLLSTPRQLRDMHEIGLDMATFFRLGEYETITTMTHWPSIRSGSKLILVTSSGYAQSYRTDQLIDNIEGPAQTRFDRPLPGTPAVLLGGEDEGYLVLLLDSGRAVRYSVGDLPLRGLQAIHRNDGEKLAGAVLTGPGEELLIINAQGYARRLKAEWIPQPPKANSRGKVQIARRPAVGLLRSSPDKGQWLISGDRLEWVDSHQLPLDNPETTRSHRLIRRGVGGTVNVVLDA